MRWLKPKPLLITAVILLVLFFLFMPKPLEADMGFVEIGALRVSVQEDGKTRVRDLFEITAPLSGKLLRIDLRPGDAVEAGVTPVATIVPVAPALLDARARAEAKGRVAAAQARLEKALAEQTRARQALAFAQSELERQTALWESKQISDESIERSRTEFQLRKAEEETAAKGVGVAGHELEVTKAALLIVSDGGGKDQGDGLFTILAPITGRVFRVLKESGGYVASGTALLELADPRDIEVVVDLLSKDAVRVQPGARVYLDHWGGETPLNGRLRLVEPAGFTKVSALGVEEQRVNVIIDFTDPPELWANLGAGFRVEAAIVLWEGENLLLAPASALVRQEDRWTVFRVEDNKAKQTPVEVGRRNGLTAQILSGLNEGDQVIVHPSDQIRDGVRVKVRE